MDLSSSGFSKSKTQTSRIIKILQILIIGLLLGFLLYNWIVIAQVDVWRHDSIYNVDGYFYKLQTEGRWINYLLWPFLRLVNPHISLLVIYLSLAFFTFSATRKIVRSIPYALIVSLIIIQIPFLSISIVGWPTTPLPAFVALALSAYLAGKMPMHRFMFLFGVIFFGTASSLFFLMPLLFVYEISFKKFVHILVVWVAAFVFGYVFAQLMTYLNSFELFHLADWRQPHYIGTVNDLVVNANTALRDFIQHNKLIIGVISPVLMLMALLLSVVTTKSKAGILSVLLYFVAGIAIYVTVIPAGIIVSPRTAFTYWTCLVFIFLVKARMTDGEKILALIMAAMIGSNTALANNEVLTWYSGLTNTMKAEMQRTMPLTPDQTNLVLLSMRESEISGLERKIESQLNLTYIAGERFSDAGRIVPVLKALGYENVRPCSDCSSLYDQADGANEPGSAAMFKSALVGPGEVVVFINKDFIE